MRLQSQFPLSAMILCMVFLNGTLFFAHAQTNTARKTDLPVPVRHLISTVKTAMDKEDWKTAIEAIQAADAKAGGPESQAPCSHPLICLALGNSHLMEKDLSRAETAYLCAIALDPAYLDARVNLARVYTDANRYADASRTFSAAYELSDPKQSDFLYYSGVMTLTDGNAGRAAQIFQQLFAAHPSKVTRQWKKTYAHALMAAEHWKTAVPLVEDLINTSPKEDRIKWQDTLLGIYLTLDDKPKALNLARALVREAPTMARWWKALVHIRLNLGQYEKALENLIIYGFLTPLSQKENQLIADLCLQLQVPDRAARAYETLLRDSKDQCPKKIRQIVERLVNAYCIQGKTQKAMALIAEIDPKACNPELLLIKGDLLYADKNYKAADEAFRKAARKNCEKKGQAWLMAGYASWQCNNLVASRHAFEHAARFKRHRKDALAAIEQLERTRQM